MKHKIGREIVTYKQTLVNNVFGLYKSFVNHSHKERGGTDRFLD